MMNDIHVQSRMPQNANSDFYARILGSMPTGGASPAFKTDHSNRVSNLPAFLQHKIVGSNPRIVAPNNPKTLCPEILHFPGKKRVAEDRYDAFPAAFLLFGCPEVATPPVTVVLEGRSICQRICLQDHSSYDTFAQALRNMFEDLYGIENTHVNSQDVTLANAVPGHVIAYEDIEGDLLLAGDLSWRDFVRAAKRIRILPAKKRSKARA